MATITSTHRQIATLAFPFSTLLSAAGLAGCPSSDREPSKPVDAAPSGTSAPAPWVPAPREGCIRSGMLEALETDPTCVVARADESLTRETMKTVTIELKPDQEAVVAGGTVLIRLSLTNRGSTEAELVFMAQPAFATARPDWTRLAGVPELRPTSGESFHLVMPMRTLDAHERSVDGLPTTPQVAASQRLLRVRLRPGAKLTHDFAWWALRIPAPMPIYYDDAGHRFVPKTAPTPLPPGEYGVAVTLPLYGVSPAESVAAARMRVDKIEKLGRDAGAAAH